MKREINFIIIFLITIIIFFLLFLKIDLNQLILNIRNIKISYLILALLISTIFNIFICSYKLKTIIKLLGVDIPFKESLFMRLGSYSLMLISPLKAGEIVNAFYLKNVHNTKFRKGISVIIIDRIMSVVSLLLFVLAGISFFLGIFYSLPIFIVLIFILLFPKKIVPKKYRLRNIQFRSLFYLTLISTTVQFSKIINIFIFFKAFNIKVPVITTALYTQLIILFSSIPITISGFGTREAGILYFFSEYASPEKLLSSALLLSLAEYIFPAVAGIFVVHKLLARSIKK